MVETLDLEMATTTRALELGGLGPDFNLLGTDKKQYSLSTFDAEKHLVLIFSSNGCPTVKACEDRMINIQNDYRAKNVRLLAINSNNEHLSPADSYDEMVKRSIDKKFNFPYVKDADQSVARSYGAICTPHVFVLDMNHILRYRGRIDDSRDASRVTSTDLRNTLDDLLVNGSVRVPETKPFGCSIVW
jgi:peroxiredoxin